MRARPLFLVHTLALGIGAWLSGANAQAATDTPAAPSPDEVRKALATPESTAALTVGYQGDPAPRHNTYRGFQGEGTYVALDMDFVHRDDPSGTWTRLYLHDLGKDNPEFRIGHEQQGRWAIWLQGSRTTRTDPRVATTGLQGAGTGTQVIGSSAPKRELTLSQQRDTLALGLQHIVNDTWSVKAGLRQDDTQGSRLFGRGTSNVMEFLTEPIDGVTTQWHTLVNYNDRRWQFSGGYNGSHYTNHIPLIRSSGGNTTAFGSSWVMAQPASNMAHQVHLSGGTELPWQGRTSFKLSRTLATQNQAFDPVFVRLAGAPGALDGRVVTSLAFWSLTAEPFARTSVTATARHEHRDDQTPENRYLAAQTPASNGILAGVSGLNKPRSFTQTTYNLDAHHRLNGQYRISTGVADETLGRNVPDLYRRMAFREQTRERTLRVELKRSLDDTLNGTLALSHGARTGSDYIPDTYAAVAQSNQLASLLWADRQRDKLRLSTDWQASERWGVQALAEMSHDSYSGRALGPRLGVSQFLSADSTYTLSERWSVSAWTSYRYTDSRQRSNTDRTATAAAGGNTLWQADIDQVSLGAGLSVKGQLRSGLTLGLDLSDTQDTVRHDLSRLGGTGTLAMPVLPKQRYRQFNAKVFTEGLLRRGTTARLELAVDRRSQSDWTWDNWLYNGGTAIAQNLRTSDGTTVQDPALERAVSLRLVVLHRWQ